MLKCIILLTLFIGSVFAQDLPEHLENALGKSREFFVSYGAKTPSQIADGSYDETEAELFLQIDQISNFNVIFTKAEIKEFKKQMVILISENFSPEQIKAIIQISKELLNKNKASGLFEVALEYQLANKVSPTTH